MFRLLLNPSRRHAAIAWLDAHLPPGVVVEAGEMLRRAGAAGHRPYMICMARYALSIESVKGGGSVNPPWFWERRSDASPAACRN
jgi:hypothetical protein